MKNRRMRTRMYGGVRGRKTKKVGRNSKIFVFLLLDFNGYVKVWGMVNILAYKSWSFSARIPKNRQKTGK